MPNYRAVLFDLDGTLVDTLEDLADAMNAVLAQAGLPTHPVEAYKYFVGDGVEMLVRRALPERRLDEAIIPGYADAMRAAYAERWSVKSRPYDGVPELLDALRDRGIAMAVLSNKPDEFTQKIISTLLPDWRFARVAGATASTPKKPNPAAALRIASELDIPPEQFLYVGDTNTDMRTAVAADMYPVGVLWGFRTAEELVSHGAETLIRRPMELMELLD